MAAPLEMLAGVVAGVVSAPTRTPSARAGRVSLSPVSSAATIAASSTATTVPPAARAPAASLKRPTEPSRAPAASPPPAKRHKSDSARAGSSAKAANGRAGNGRAANSRTAATTSAAAKTAAAAAAKAAARSSAASSTAVAAVGSGPAPTSATTSARNTQDVSRSLQKHTRVSRPTPQTQSQPIPKTSQHPPSQQQPPHMQPQAPPPQTSVAQVQPQPRTPYREREASASATASASASASASPLQSDGREDDNDRRALRAERNRQSAAASRERKKRHVKELEGRVRVLNDMVATLQHRVQADSQDWYAKEQHLLEENQMLRSQLAESMSCSDPLLKPLRSSMRQSQQASQPYPEHALILSPPRSQNQAPSQQIPGQALRPQQHQPPHTELHHHASSSANPVRSAPESNQQVDSRQRISHIVLSNSSRPELSAQSANSLHQHHVQRSQQKHPQHVSHLVHQMDSPEEHTSHGRYHGHQSAPTMAVPQLPSSTHMHTLPPYQHVAELAPRAMDIAVQASATPVHAGVPRPQL